MTNDYNRDEIVEAVEDSGVCCPETVCDAVLAVAETGGDWRAELAKAVARDLSESRGLTISE